MSVLEVVRKALIEECGVQSKDQVYVALSGGADSMALLTTLYALRDELQFVLKAIHIHHGLRVASDEEEAMVVKHCEALGIECYTHHIDLSDENCIGKSVEEAARDMRYDIFDAYLKGGSKWIALGHHMGDQAETVLFNVLRGTGLKGLSGMQVVRDNYIRPMLTLSKEALIEYCEASNIPYAVDQSNLESIYTRNKIRNELIPYIEDNIQSNVVESVSRMAKLISEESMFIEELVDRAFDDLAPKITPEEIVFNRDKFCHFSMVVQRRLLRRAYEDLKGDMRNLSFVHIQEACELVLGGKTGKEINLPGEILVKNDYNQVYVMKIHNQVGIRAVDEQIDLTSLEIGESLSVGPLMLRRMVLEKDAEIPKKPYTKWFDYDKIGVNLVLRGRYQDDYININDLGQRQKLKKFFINNKISKSLRDNIPLIAKGQEVIWIIGYRTNLMYQVTSETKEILEVCYIKEDNNER